MNPFFKQHLETAQKANGITFDVLTDWADLLDLSRLADVVTNAQTRGDAAMLRPCIEVGGQVFHRITIGGAEWFQRVSKLFDGDHGEAYSLAFAYAFFGARDPVALLWPYGDDRRKLIARLKEWAKSLGCTATELFQALGDFHEEESDGLEKPGGQPEEESKPTAWGWVIDRLMSEYGGTPEKWIWETPRATVGNMLAEIDARHDREKGNVRSDPNDPRVIASHRFDLKLKAIVAKKKAKNGP